MDDIEFKVTGPFKPFVKRKKASDKASHGMFVVNYDAVAILLQNDASALQICAFLTLSCFSKPNTPYRSTANYSALVNRLGIGLDKARRLIDALCDMEYMGEKLLKPPDSAFGRGHFEEDENGRFLSWERIIDYSLGVNEGYVANKGKHGFIRWVLPSKHDDDLWLNKSLVGEGRSTDKPLKTLWRLCGDVATKLYFYLCTQYYLDLDIVHPNLVSYEYDVSSVYNGNGIELLKVVMSEDLPDASDYILKLVAGCEYTNSNKSYDSVVKQTLSALNVLEKRGFIYKSVIVAIAPADSDIVSNYYELDCKIINKSRYKKQLFCNDIRNLAVQLGMDAGRIDSRFYKEYFAVVPAKMRVNVSMVYRLRHGLTNPNNYRVSMSLDRRTRHDAEVHEWIAKLGSVVSPAKD